MGTARARLWRPCQGPTLAPPRWPQGGRQGRALAISLRGEKLHVVITNQVMSQVDGSAMFGNA